MKISKKILKAVAIGIIATGSSCALIEEPKIDHEICTSECEVEHDHAMKVTNYDCPACGMG